VVVSRTAGASVAIILVTVIVLWIWYRNICRSLLSGRGLEQPGLEFLKVNSLESPFRVEAWKRGEQPAELIRVSLHQDFSLCEFLLNNAFNYAGLKQSLDVWFLKLDFRLLTFVDTLAGRWSSRVAEATILERARILIFFANAMGAPEADANPNQSELPASLQ
jgi:hypothetical protein